MNKDVKTQLDLYRKFLDDEPDGPGYFTDDMWHVFCVPCGNRLLLAEVQLKASHPPGGSLCVVGVSGEPDCCDACGNPTKSPTAGESDGKEAFQLPPLNIDELQLIWACSHGHPIIICAIGNTDDAIGPNMLDATLLCMCPACEQMCQLKWQSGLGPPQIGNTIRVTAAAPCKQPKKDGAE